MEGRKRTAKSIIGRKASTGPVRLTPRMLPDQPHWKMATRMPKEAPMESRFMKAALMGTAIERKTDMRSRKLRAMTAAKKIGRRDDMWLLTSMKRAVEPPTSGCPPESAKSLRRLL